MSCSGQSTEILVDHYIREVVRLHGFRLRLYWIETLDSGHCIRPSCEEFGQSAEFRHFVSFRNRWTVRKNDINTGRHAESMHDGLWCILGRLHAFAGIFI